MDIFQTILMGCTCTMLICITIGVVAFTITVVRGFFDN